ncbi:MAG: nitroreductase family protein [Erysipelotrichaceae bacterium]|nr:nitroreductase family protein [Erysipelotrichaceae bacterium]
MENVVLDSLKTRRSVRKYLDKPVESEKIDAILEAGF